MAPWNLNQMSNTPEISGQELPYTPREIREKWHDMNNSIQDVSNDIQSVLSQVKLTNGSIAEINRWRERINGGAIVSGVFMTVIVVPILAWAIFVLVNIQESIHKSIQDALSAYDLTIK